jgi:methylenetetrahydrofolate reductase (NADPH)
VGASIDELRSVIGAYADAGVGKILALRGDPPVDEKEGWRARPDGLEHAVQLVELVRSLGDFEVGVAAFPEGHPESKSFTQDIDVLVMKQAAGASFAITQLFFKASDYRRLVENAQAAGVSMPLIPGVMPITNVAQIEKFAALSGAAMPPELLARFDAVRGDDAAVLELGVEVAVELCQDLIAGGTPGLHFYTLNRSNSTREVYQALGLGRG